jgi:hypothetical protein
MSPNEKIILAKDLLNELQKSVSKIISLDSEAFNTGEMGNYVEKLKVACNKSLERLEQPSLRVSTIGTTSSGKSTFVNAIIGRRLAPMESSEMSAGILKFTHGNKSILEVKKTDGAKWETGVWEDLNDEEIYRKLRATEREDGFDGIMTAYHKAKKKDGRLEAPMVEITVPLLPMAVKEMLNLPEGVHFELLDLPGLKNIKDGKNIKIIQDQVENSFSLVILGYDQTDDSNRGRLLKELKSVVEGMGGKTDAMMFLLNKINLRNRVDLPLEDRIEQLNLEIMENLDLNFDPGIMGVDALFLYYIQCIWGPFEKPLPFDGIQSELSEGLLDDCSKTFREKRKVQPEVKEWLSRYEDNLGGLQNENFEGLRKIFKWGHQWSGGHEFWSNFRNRVEEKFSELVIFPAISNTLKECKNFEEKARDLSHIRKMLSEEEIDNECKLFDRKVDTFMRLSQEKKESFKAKIGEVKEGLQTSPTSLDEGFARAEKNLPELGFIDKIFGKIQDDLLTNIVVPLRGFLNEGTSTLEVQDWFSNFLESDLTRKISHSYEEVLRHCTFNQKVQCDEAWHIEIRLDDSEKVKEYENKKTKLRFFFQRVRESINFRAEYLVSIESIKIKDAVSKSLNKALLEIVDESSSIIDLNNSLQSEGETLKLPEILNEDKIELPEGMFSFFEAKQVEKIAKKEKVAEKVTYKTVDEGSCFEDLKKVPQKTDVVKDVYYSKFYFPNAEDMANQWSVGIDKERIQVLESIFQWVSRLLDEALDGYKDSLFEHQKFIQQECKLQKDMLYNEGVIEKKKWDSVEESLDLELKNIYLKLYENAVPD